MKRLSFIFFFAGFVLNASAQTTNLDTLPPYKKNPQIPDFSIQLTDSTWFNKEQLPKSEFTAIINFDPECGHCQNTVKELAASMIYLKNVFFVFVAYKSIPEIKEFYHYYGLEKFTNIRMGRDPKYFVPSFFRVTANPFVAVYNQSGTLARVFDPALNTTIEVPLLLSMVNKN